MNHRHVPELFLLVHGMRFRFEAVYEAHLCEKFKGECRPLADKHQPLDLLKLNIWTVCDEVDGKVRVYMKLSELTKIFVTFLKFDQVVHLVLATDVASRSHSI